MNEVTQCYKYAQGLLNEQLMTTFTTLFNKLFDLLSSLVYVLKSTRPQKVMRPGPKLGFWSCPSFLKECPSKMVWYELKLYKMIQNGSFLPRQTQKLPVKMTGMTGPTRGPAWGHTYCWARNSGYCWSTAWHENSVVSIAIQRKTIICSSTHWCTW